MTTATRVHLNEHIFLRLSSGQLKAVHCKPNSIIEISRGSSFPIDALLDRPFYTTFELLEKQEGETYPRLRVVSPHELENERLTAEASLQESRDVAEDSTANDGDFELVTEQGQVVIKNNRLIVDDNNRQLLSHQEIEELKKSAGGKEIIEKILANHTALGEKTVYSKAKYTLRKTKKYLKRFSVVPMELGLLAEYILEKEPGRILDLREEPLALVTSWSNAHWHAQDDVFGDIGGKPKGDGRILLVDDSGGLVLAALAERKGILRAAKSSRISNGNAEETEEDAPFDHNDYPIPAKANSITLLHSATQPNISLLKYFGYDANHPDQHHPLHNHLKPLSWLQLLHPEDDPMYQEPAAVDEATLATWRPGKRGTHFKKQRRWQRTKAIVDETRDGGFDALVVATHMELVSIFPHLVPLLRGGAHVVVYSPTIESLLTLMDLYSKERRMAYIAKLQQNPDQVPDPTDFPVDPRLLLAPTLQTSRIREYQVLPGRTHPLMTSRGGSEGYVFTARRVLPVTGVEARGNFAKKRKVDAMDVTTSNT